MQVENITRLWPGSWVVRSKIRKPTGPDGHYWISVYLMTAENQMMVFQGVGETPEAAWANLEMLALRRRGLLPEPADDPDAPF
jgi:hypothetical protein